MNVVDQFLSKVGKQTLLTSKAMMNGFLPKEEAEELERLRAIDFEIDMQALSFWERHAQGGMFRSKFDITGVNRVASTELLKFVNQFTEIEIKYEISSIEADLSRWSEIITVLNTAEEEFGVTKEEVNAFMYYFFVVGNRLTIHPTAPSVLRATIPTFISGFEDIRETRNVEAIKNDSTNSFSEILDSFLTEASPTKLIEKAAAIFNSENIIQLAKASGKVEDLKGLDAVREAIIENIDDAVEVYGFIDYRLLLVSMFITQVRFALENEVEK